MRTDVKLGVVIALATVLVAGGYYMDGGGDDKPIEINGKSLADAAKSSAAQKPHGRAATPAKSQGAARQPSVRGTQGKAFSGKRHRGTTAQRKSGTPPPASIPPKNVQARASQQSKKRLGKAAASKTPKPQTTGASTAGHAVGPTSPGATSTGGARAATPVPSAASHVKKTVPADASRTSRSPGRTDARRANAHRPAGRTRGTRVGSTQANASAQNKQSGQSARGVRRPIPRDAAQGKAFAKKGQTRAARRNPATLGNKTEHHGVAVDTHRVQPGDSLAALAKMYYGHEKFVPFLLKSNPEIGDPRRLVLGTIVRIPPLPTTEPSNEPAPTSVKKASAREGTRTSGSARSYTVKAGDTFYGIARSQLGDANRWRALYELNASLVGDDPSRLKIGQVIDLPAK